MRLVIQDLRYVNVLLIKVVLRQCVGKLPKVCYLIWNDPDICGQLNVISNECDAVQTFTWISMVLVGKLRREVFQSSC